MKLKIYTLKDFSDFVDSHISKQNEILRHQKNRKVDPGVEADYLLMFEYAKVAIALFKHEAQEKEIAAISKGFIVWLPHPTLSKSWAKTAKPFATA